MDADPQQENPRRSLFHSQLVRFGEDKNSFYLLTESDATRLQLFEKLCQEPTSPQRWLDLLRHPATYRNANLYAQTRLFRRATTLIPKDANKQNASFAEIWIRFAALDRSEKECRDTFKFIKSEKIGEKMELFYREYAVFEAKHGNLTEADTILALGVEAGAFDMIRKQQLAAQIGLSSAGSASSVHHTPRATCITSSASATTLSSLAPGSNGFQRTTFSTPKPSFSAGASSSTTSSTWISTATTTMASTLGHESLSSGQKLHLTRHDQQLLSTPSMTNASRTASLSRAMTTSKKASVSIPSFRLSKPLRVPIAESDHEDEDQDVVMSSSLSREPQAEPEVAREPREPNKLSPISESEKVNNSRDETDTFSKVLVPKEETPIVAAPKPSIDLSYIKKWKPREQFSSDISGNNTNPYQQHPSTSITSSSTSTVSAAATPALAYGGSQANVMMNSMVVDQHGSKGVGKLDTMNGTRGVAFSEQKYNVVSTPATTSSTPKPWANSVQHDSPISPPRSSNNLNNQTNQNSQMERHQRIKALGVQFSSPLGSSSSESPTSNPTSSPVVAMEKPRMSPRNPLDSILNKRVTVSGRQYLLLEQIGSGGSSKVYRILGQDLKIYALKKIKLKNLDSKTISQYQNEIKLLQELRGSPFIIRFIAADSDPQRRLLYVVMEHGELDLDQKLQQLNDVADLDEDFLRPTWKQMLRAVDVIHSNRIIHGDLKPANFVFANGALKLIDFGIAKVIKNDTTNITRHSQVGTVNYMSPEAIQGNSHTTHTMYRDQRILKVDRASDIWSLGCILYQIVYGKPPFADLHSILDKFRGITDPNYEIPFPKLKNEDLEDVMRSCLQRDHRRRPPIQGPNGLLNHPFLRGKCWICRNFKCTC